MNIDELEVVWPLHKHHYLTAHWMDEGSDMAVDATEAADVTSVSATGRDLAARALVAGALCTRGRAGDLLKTSRRSVGRAIETDVGAALQDEAVVAEARTVLAETAHRGSTAEERTAAETWLAAARRDERSTERSIETPSLRTPPGRSKKRVSKPAARAAMRLKNGQPPETPILSLEALERQQQRILHRTQVIDYVLVAEQRNGASLTLGAALAELLHDISDAAQTIGTILHPVPPRRA